MTFDELQPTGAPIRDASCTDEQTPMLALVLIGCEFEPWRIGQSTFYPQGKVFKVGRGGTNVEEFSSFDQHRPGDSFPLHRGFEGCLHGDSVSRHQANIKAEGLTLWVENVGKHAMFVNGQPIPWKTWVPVKPGDVVMVDGGVALQCVLRLPNFPALRFATMNHPFGEADIATIVGESQHTWGARDQATRLGQGTDYVLILGPTGTGKTGIARLIHAVSRRADGPFRAHNSANFTDSLLESQLFGKLANFPTPGPGSEGLLAKAHRGTLLFDEIGNMPVRVQELLLTTMEDGVYKRLGEDALRQLDVRFIGATNRERGVLLGDFQFRLTTEIRLVPLSDRREDIPFLTRELARRRLENDEKLARFFFKGPHGEMIPRISVRLAASSGATSCAGTRESSTACLKRRSREARGTGSRGSRKARRCDRCSRASPCRAVRSRVLPCRARRWLRPLRRTGRGVARGGRRWC